MGLRSFLGYWRAGLLIVGFVLLPLFAGFGADEYPDARFTLVVYNSNDPLSENLAHFYAGKRGVPGEQVVGLPCSMSEEISRKQYDEQIAGPLRKVFDDRGWWRVGEKDGQKFAVSNQIRFVALMRGVPVKIMEAFGYPGDKPNGPPAIAAHNEAAVDSELATLGFFTRSISGALINPYFRSFRPFPDANMPPLMLVCRLDAPTGTVVRRMINDSIEAEKNGVWGFTYLDTRNLTSGGLAEGDAWLQAIGKDMRRNGVPVVQSHGRGMFPEHYPMRNAAFYYGWYSEHASGPFKDPDFEFNPGAVAVHIHSFSATMIRDPKFGWVAPLLMRGAAATTGNVYEPFLALTPNLDVFHERLSNGFNFAEACYASEKVLSWMTTFVGDPLYRPFKFFQDLNPKPPPGAEEWWEFREGTRTYYLKDKSAGAQALRNAGRRLKSGVIFEGLASIFAAEKEFDAALEASRTARGYYQNPEDVVRVAIREANMLAGVNRYRDAIRLLTQTIKEYPKLPAASVARDLRTDLEKEMRE